MNLRTEALAPQRSLTRVFALEAKYELLKVLRLPAYAIPTISFPLLFYFFFGVVFGAGRSAGPISMSTYLLATYGGRLTLLDEAAEAVRRGAAGGPGWRPPSAPKS